jgi:hypothetical protein
MNIPREQKPVDLMNERLVTVFGRLLVVSYQLSLANDQELSF